MMIRLSAACGVVERLRGDRVSVATMHRWVQRGLRGVRLRTIYAGGHRRTTERWLREFFDRITDAANGRATEAEHSPLVTGSRASRIDAARRELAASGIDIVPA